MPSEMEPPLKAPLKPVVAAPYSASGVEPSTLVQEPASGFTVLWAVLLVQISLPLVSAIPVSARDGELPFTSKTMPVRAFPWAVVRGSVVLVSTTESVPPLTEKSAVPDAVVLASGL